MLMLKQVTILCLQYITHVSQFIMLTILLKDTCFWMLFSLKTCLQKWPFLPNHPYGPFVWFINIPMAML